MFCEDWICAKYHRPHEKQLSRHSKKFDFPHFSFASTSQFLPCGQRNWHQNHPFRGKLSLVQTYKHPLPKIPLWCHYTAPNLLLNYQKYAPYKTDNRANQCSHPQPLRTQNAFFDKSFLSLAGKPQSTYWRSLGQ